MNKTFAIGDIHGGYKALVQCLERSKFDKEKDTLITLGDIADGWSQVPECVDELLTIKNRIDIIGNHDWWLNDWLQTGIAPNYWLEQGGQASMDAYLNLMEDPMDKYTGTLERHKSFFNNQHYYYIDDRNRLFVHGGLNWHMDIKANNKKDLMWDRHAFYTACYWELESMRQPTEPKKYFKDYKEVFVGHTCTNHGLDKTIGNTTEPLHVSNMWNLDQGAGWGNGRLSIMNVNTKQFWQSDPVNTLYPEEHNSRK